MVNSDIQLELIGAMMGHRNTETTKKYARLKKVEKLREVFER